MRATKETLTPSELLRNPSLNIDARTNNDISQAIAKEAMSTAASKEAALLRSFGPAEREPSEVPPLPAPVVGVDTNELEELDTDPWLPALDAAPPEPPLELPELPQEFPPLLSTAIEPPSVTSFPSISLPQSSVSDEPFP